MIAVFFTVLASVNDYLPEIQCNRIKIEDNWYEREILLAKLGKTSNLNIHKVTNTLFFSYTVQDFYSYVDFQVAFIKNYNEDYETIAGIRGGCSIAIDQENNEIYLGGSHGIHKYNMVTRIADFYKEEGVNIWSLFHRRNLFYISYPDQKLHMEVDGAFATVKEFHNIEIDIFYINNDNVIYLANKTGLYKYNSIRMITEVVNDLISVRQITEDNDCNMYFCTNTGLFKIDKKDGTFKHVLNVNNLHGIAFDGDNNFVLSDDKSIMKLVRSNIGCSD